LGVVIGGGGGGDAGAVLLLGRGGRHPFAMWEEVDTWRLEVSLGLCGTVVGNNITLPTLSSSDLVGWG
jgi:hypothetical protein